MQQEFTLCSLPSGRCLQETIQTIINAADLLLLLSPGWAQWGIAGCVCVSVCGSVCVRVRVWQEIWPSSAVIGMETDDERV